MVVDSGSFSAAAKALGMSKAYISQRVTQLEDRLGVRLLQRTTRRLSLTDAGELYYRYASQVTTQLAEGEERVRDLREQPKGTLRVTLVDGGLGEWYLAPALARFAVLYPEISLELDLSSRLADLVAENYDFAIRVGTLADSSLMARRLTSFRYGLYVAPGYLKENGVLCHPEQLYEHNCLTGATPLWTFEQGQETVAIKPSGRWHSKSGQTLIYAASLGLGIVRTASFYASEALKNGRVTEILPEWTRRETPVSIVFPSDRNLPHRVRIAMNFLLEDFRGDAPWDY